MRVEDMKGGYTTGSCATAGMKASLRALLDGQIEESLYVEGPQGQHIEVPIESVEIISPNRARACVIKDAGDDPDVTHGTEIVTEVELNDSGVLAFRAGPGVGTVTKVGLQIPPGQPAINPGPRAMMQLVFDEFCWRGRGCTVTISVPQGQDLAKKTLNHTLGIEGGISIIGTTGVVKPMSEEGFKNSLVPQLEVMKANGCQTAILVPGRIGQDIAEESLGLHKNQMAETSNFIGFMLEQAVRIGFKRVLIIGHIGKLIKLASGSFHTHNRMSDGRMETLVAFAALEGASQLVCQEIYRCQTTEGAMKIIDREGLQGVYQRIVERATLRSERYVAQDAQVGIIIATLDGQIITMSDRAKSILQAEDWSGGRV